jgi:hypothetical protein
MNNALQNEPCIWYTSLNAEEDEKELFLEYFFLPREFPFSVYCY